MNLNNNPTKEDLAQLLASQNDNEGTHILWIDHAGNVQIATLAHNLSPVAWEDEMEGQYKFRMESYSKGAGYVGTEASQDDEWVTSLYSQLLKEWQESGTGFIDL